MRIDPQGWLYVAAILLPLGSFVIGRAFGRWLGTATAYLSTASIAGSLVLSLAGLVTYMASAPGMITRAPAQAEVESVAPDRRPLAWTGGFDWIVLGAEPRAPIALPVGIAIDNLAALLFVMVAAIGTLVHVYSIAYLRDDPGLPRYFAQLSLFCFAMLGLIAASNLLLVFVFWELVGICSYLLIGFWRDDSANVGAANKAFVVNRVGDVGLLVGLGILWGSLGTLSIDGINRGLRDEAGKLNMIRSADGAESVELRDRGNVGGTAGNPRKIAVGLLTIAGLGIFAGCAGKSAQFPLHVWLPDAMAGPTPVSALIHAATMVAAGVYLAARFFPIFTPAVLLTMAYSGGITLIVASTIALVQTDYKKVLAYSTMGQLGFMMLGIGVGGWAAGLFHLMTHAAFKALLFLGAGSIFHAVGTYEMTLLGGLRRKMPVTSATMLLATLAIAGVPFFSGFYSKDAILASAFYLAGHHPNPAHWLLAILPTIGASLTALYMFRLWFLVFGGEPRDAEIHGRAHESGRLMAWPLIALAVPTVALGWSLRPSTLFVLPIGEPLLEEWIAYGEPIRANDLGASRWYSMTASVLVAAVGIAVAFAAYSPRALLDPRRIVGRVGPVHRFLVRKWYIDDLYAFLFVRPALGLARGASILDRRLIDALVEGVAALAVALSRFGGAFDRAVVDGIVNQTGRALYALGGAGARLQTGRLRGYLTVLALAVVAISLGVFAWVRRA